MKKMKSILGVTLALTCMISTMTTLAAPSTEKVDGAKDSGYTVQTNYIPVRGIPVLSLEEELTKRASLNETQKLEAHKIIEDLKNHLEEGDYDQVEKDYQALDRLVGNIQDEEIEVEEQQGRDEEARLAYEELLAEQERVRLEYQEQLEEEEKNWLQEQQRREEEEQMLIEEKEKRDEEARIVYEELLAKQERARLEYEQQLEEEEKNWLQEQQKREEEDQRLIEEKEKRDEEARLAYEELLAEQERARLEYEQQLEEEENEEQENEEPQNLEIVSLTKEEILTELTRESLKAQLKFIADRSYIAHKDIDGYLNSFDKMKEAQKANEEETAEKHAESIKMIIDYYVSYQ